MENNELQIRSIINRNRTINRIKLKNSKSQIRLIPKYNNSRNINSKSINETSSNFSSIKNFIQSKYNSKDIRDNSNKNRNNKKDINSYRRTYSVNFVKFDKNYLRRISSKNANKEYEKKNNSNMFSLININQTIDRKIDFFNYVFLLRQKEYFKKLFQHFDFKSPSRYIKTRNRNLNKISKKYSYNNRLKKIYFQQNEHLIKDDNKNISTYNFKTINNFHNKTCYFNGSNYDNIKIKKYNAQNNLQKIKGFLSAYNKRKNKNLNEKEKIIDDNYKEYLKGISSDESDENKTKSKIFNKKNNKVKFNKIKNKILLFDKSDIYSNIKRINNNSNSNIIIKNNNNKYSRFKTFIINRKKSFENVSKSINIKNSILRKKLKI